MIRSCWAAVIVILAADAEGASCADVADPAERLGCFDALADCAMNADPQARLACYDAADRSTRPRAAGEPDASSRLSRDEDVFPVRGKPRPEQEPASLVAHITGLGTDRRGRRSLTLDNGQVWRELSPGRLLLEVGTEVELRRGVLGSVNLHAVGRDGYVKVRRVE